MRKFSKGRFMIWDKVWNKKGFTLMDALASMIALGLIALTVQSLILLTNQFFHRKRASFGSLESRILINNMICNRFSEPVFVQLNPQRTFSFDSDTNTYTKLSLSGNLQKASFSVPLVDMVELSGTDTKVKSDYLAGEFIESIFIPDTDITTPGSSSPLRAHIDDKASNFSLLQRDGNTAVQGSRDYLSQFYDLYSDTHTLVAYQVDFQGIDSPMGSINKGVIYASRCAMLNPSAGVDREEWFGADENSTHRVRSIQDSSHENTSPEKVVGNAFHVLENPWRPFYFPSKKDSYAKIQCCDIEALGSSLTDADPTQGDWDGVGNGSICKSLKWAYPVTFAINIESLDIKDIAADDKSMNGFFQNHTDELDQLDSNNQECNNSGFRFDYERTSCQNKAREIYGQKLLEFFSYPVKFASIYELPMSGINRATEDRKAVWATAFTADHMEGASVMGSSIVKMNLLSVENKCHSFLPDHMCEHSHGNAEIAGKKMIDYFQTKSYSCPFVYRNMRNSGTSIPMGTIL